MLLLLLCRQYNVHDVWLVMKLQLVSVLLLLVADISDDDEEDENDGNENDVDDDPDDDPFVIIDSSDRGSYM